MKKILYLSLMLSAVAVKAQTFEWLQFPTVAPLSNFQNTGYNTAADASGNIYFTGYKADGTNYNDVMSTLYYNKYSTDGQLVFTKEIGGKACNYALEVDNQGNVLMALGYLGTITIDGVTISTIEQGDHFLLAKFDAQGNLLWHRLVITDEEFTWTNEFRAIDTDEAGNIYIGYDNYGTSYIDKYSPDGDKLLGITQTDVNRITSVSVDTEGNIYAAGACAGIMATYAGISLPSPFQYNTYVVKYSAQGEYQWLRYTDDITCPEPHVVARTPDEVYYSSYLFGAFDFDGHETNGPEGGMFDDFFIAKLNASGTYQWVREVEGNAMGGPGSRNYIAMDNEGNVYFAGTTRGTIDWGNSIITDTPINSSRSAMVLRLNPEGVATMAATVEGDGFNRADGITVDHQGNIFMSGVGNSNATFGAISHNAGNFEYYPFLAKISQTTMGIPVPEHNAMMVWPNPADDVLYLSGVTENTSGTILNSLGQEVMIFTAGSLQPIAVDLLADGIYFVSTPKKNLVRFVKKK